MKKKIIIGSIVFLILITICCTILFIFKDKIFYKTDYVETKNRKDYIIKTVDDTLLENYLSKREKTMVVIIASWCEYCKEQANDLNRFINTYPKVNVIVVAHDEQKSDITPLLKENNFNWFVLLDPARSIRTLLEPEANSIPRAYIIDENGNVVNKSKGSMSFDEFCNLYFYDK